jgi:hypothetical protein
MLYRYEEWYTRALMPGVTHISIPDDDTMCNATYQKVCHILHAAVQQRLATVWTPANGKPVDTLCAKLSPFATASAAKPHRLQQRRIYTLQLPGQQHAGQLGHTAGFPVPVSGPTTSESCEPRT